jgi:hypothetical protein
MPKPEVARLVFAPTDRARFDGSGAFPSVELFSVDLEDEGGSSDALRLDCRSRGLAGEAITGCLPRIARRGIRDGGLDLRCSTGRGGLGGHGLAAGILGRVRETWANGVQRDQQQRRLVASGDIP